MTTTQHKLHSKLVYDIKLRELPEEEILKKKLFHVFVFGLPRTGTSMMTHICELLGVKMIHTSEENKDKRKNIPEGEYQPNATGFYEVTKDVWKNYLDIVATPYSGCKMIIPVNNFRLGLIQHLPSKVIMMEREPEEIRQSQNAMYAEDANIAYIRTALASEKVKLRENNIDHIVINYRDVIKNPRQEIQKIKEFILSDNDIEEAVKFVNPEAYRFDQDKITKGL